MPTYLLTWSGFKWTDLPEAIATTATGHLYELDWTVHAHRRIKPGDRVFLTHIGKDVRGKKPVAPAGIIAAGHVTIAPRLMPHWDEERRAAGEMVYKAGVAFDRVLDPQHVLPEADLPKSASAPDFRWAPENSGIGIPEDLAGKLERQWGAWTGGGGKARARTDWTQEELAAIVTDYFQMLGAELRNEPYSKTAHRRALLPRLQGRSHASIEFKHRNISAILQESRLPSIEGYRPAANYQDALADAVDVYVADHPQWASRAEAVSTPVVQQYRIEEVLTPPPRSAERAPQPPLHLAVSVDYLAAQAANAALGRAGEEFVLALETRYLTEHGRADLAGSVDHVARTLGDGLGFDIRSFGIDGSEKFIEVKTTNLGPSTAFYVSPREVQVSCEAAERYWVYRVYYFTRKPRLFRLKGSLAQSCKLEPAVFAARPAVQGETEGS